MTVPPHPGSVQCRGTDSMVVSVTDGVSTTEGVVATEGVPTTEGDSGAEAVVAVDAWLAAAGALPHTVQ
ncbi:hypothetical protein [Nocardia altamirensis]|uniref:hypothetical protein n=1 Tax=Nocardia altamirensis TaxID=472158 RepID=UPI0008406A96|nr:hypothetical protein [Nocardia altamirensis]